MTQSIRRQLEALADEKNAAFAAKLVPQYDPAQVLGCRTPQLRALAKSLDPDSAEVQAFLHTLPHTLFDENQLHAFLISCIRDFDACLAAVRAFVPYIDNWATCDQLLPPVFRRHAERLLPDIREWLASDAEYTLRYAIGLLMQHFLDERFDAAYPEWVCAVQSEAYYVRMEQAWYFATALAKQPAAVMPYLTAHRLPDWVHRKTVQKAVESRRIPDDMKAALRSL